MSDGDFHKVVAVHSMICTVGAALCAFAGWKALQDHERGLAALSTVVAIGLAAFALHVQ